MFCMGKHNMIYIDLIIHSVSARLKKSIVNLLTYDNGTWMVIGLQLMKMYHAGKGILRCLYFKINYSECESGCHKV
jgi:hypothetical protein